MKSDVAPSSLKFQKMKVEVNLRENLIQKIWLEKHDYYVKQTFNLATFAFRIKMALNSILKGKKLKKKLIKYTNFAFFTNLCKNPGRLGSTEKATYFT